MLPLPGEIFARVLAQLPAADENGCRRWPGPLNGGRCGGYGKVSLHGKTYYVHRVMYGFTHGFVPAEIDHLCRVRSCAEPGHLEAVTHFENMARGGSRAREMCPAGHVKANGGWYAGSRRCRECCQARARDYQRRRKAS